MAARVLDSPAREVSGTEDTLAAAIESGLVPAPDVMDWKGWLAWRKGPGKRPTTRAGDPLPTDSRQESVLWRATMQRVHGSEWRVLLEERQAQEARSKIW